MLKINLLFQWKINLLKINSSNLNQSQTIIEKFKPITNLYQKVEHLPNKRESHGTLGQGQLGIVVSLLDALDVPEQSGQVQETHGQCHVQRWRHQPPVGVQWRHNANVQRRNNVGDQSFGFVHFIYCTDFFKLKPFFRIFLKYN